MVLLGMVPVLMAVPPTTSSFSISAARLPNFEAWMAARWPAGPEPTTMRSYLSMSRFRRASISNGRAWRLEDGISQLLDACFFGEHAVDAVSTLCHDAENLFLRSRFRLWG